VVMNYARPVNRALTEGYAQAGIAVYVLDTEGGVLADDGPSTPARQATYVAESGYADLLAGYFFWGPVLRDAFAARGVLPDERLHLTGCPRFDFAAPSLRALHPPRRTGHVLVNTNYPAINPRFVAGRDDAGALRAVGYDADYVDRLLDDTRRIMAGLIATVRRLAGELPDQLFVLRPHPFESEAVYHQAFAGLANVSVEGQGDVIEALKGARALLHVNCGTAIEAIMLEVPPLSLEFLNTSHMRAHASLPSRASVSIDDPAELVAAIADGCPRFDPRARHAEFVEPWFHLNDGRAAERVAFILARDLAGARRGTGSGLLRSLQASRARPSAGQRLQALAGNILGTHGAGGLRTWGQPRRREKRFAAADVDGLLQALGEGPAAPPKAVRARHPLTKAPLASLVIRATERRPRRSAAEDLE